MICPPSLLHIRVHNQDHRLRLWLPLFVIWPPLAVLALALTPLVFIAALFLLPVGWGRPLILTGPLLFRLYCSLRGLEVDIDRPAERVNLAFR